MLRKSRGCSCVRVSCLMIISSDTDEVSLLSGFRVNRVKSVLYSAFPIKIHCVCILKYAHITVLLQYPFHGLSFVASLLAFVGILLRFMAQIVLSASDNQQLTGCYSGSATFKAKKPRKAQTANVGTLPKTQPWAWKKSTIQVFELSISVYKHISSPTG